MSRYNTSVLWVCLSYVLLTYGKDFQYGLRNPASSYWLRANDLNQESYIWEFQATTCGEFYVKNTATGKFLGRVPKTNTVTLAPFKNATYQRWYKDSDGSLVNAEIDKNEKSKLALEVNLEERSISAQQWNHNPRQIFEFTTPSHPVEC